MDIKTAKKLLPPIKSITITVNEQQMLCANGTAVQRYGVSQSVDALHFFPDLEKSVFKDLHWHGNDHELWEYAQTWRRQADGVIQERLRELAKTEAVRDAPGMTPLKYFSKLNKRWDGQAEQYHYPTINTNSRYDQARFCADPKYATKLLVPYNNGFSNSSGSWFWPLYIAYAQKATRELFTGTRTANGATPQKHAVTLGRKAWNALTADGILPETLHSLRKWNNISSACEAATLVSLGVHHSESWGMLMTQLTGEQRTAIVRHPSEFAAWPQFEPERARMRERAFALMLSMSGDPKMGQKFDAYFNAGGTLASLQSHDVTSKGKFVELLNKLLATSQSDANVRILPDTYTAPNLVLDKSGDWSWADHTSFHELSDFYGNCISNAPQYRTRIMQGQAHVLYHKIRGTDEKGRTGGAIAYITYESGVWIIREIAGYKNGVAHHEYRRYVENVVSRMNNAPEAHLRSFGGKRVEEADPYRIPLEPSIFWQDGIVLPELYCAHLTISAEFGEQQARLIA